MFRFATVTMIAATSALAQPLAYRVLEMVEGWGGWPVDGAYAFCVRGDDLFALKDAVISAEPKRGVFLAQTKFGLVVGDADARFFAAAMGNRCGDMRVEPVVAINGKLSFRDALYD